MSGPGALSPAQSYGETVTFVSRWSIGATGAHTKDFGRGFASVSRTGAGQYTINFSEVPRGPLLELRIDHWPAAGIEPKNLTGEAAGYSSANKTCLYKSWNVSTNVLIEVPSGDKVTISCTWLKSV